MIKLYLALALVATFFTNLAMPRIATLTFTADTTLSQVVDLLDQHGAWPAGDAFYIEANNSVAFFYTKGTMSTAEREQAIWATLPGAVAADNLPISPRLRDCLTSKACPVPIAHITLINPPAALLDAPIIAASESHRDLHPFFQQILGHGHHRAP